MNTRPWSCIFIPVPWSYIFIPVLISSLRRKGCSIKYRKGWKWENLEGNVKIKLAQELSLEECIVQVYFYRYCYILAMKADPLSYSSINIHNGTSKRKEDLSFMCFFCNWLLPPTFPTVKGTGVMRWDSKILNTASSK